MCPDWEFNQRPFGSQACAQSTEPHQLGQILHVRHEEQTAGQGGLVMVKVRLKTRKMELTSEQSLSFFHKNNNVSYILD